MWYIVLSRRRPGVDVIHRVMPGCVCSACRFVYTKGKAPIEGKAPFFNTQSISLSSPFTFTMRPSALVPVLLGLVALVLSLIALFAGSNKGFLEDYAVVTVRL